MSNPISEAQAGSRLPGLDGLRAFSVLLVILFHGRVAGFTGGFVGVSVFFTISGYLLTNRLLTKPLGVKSITTYWAGRWRRILPAAWTVLFGITLLEWLTDRAPVGAGRRLWTTAAGLGNWHQLWKGSSYATLFEGGDTLVHYWSLGVEEQAYLVLPLVLFVVARVGGPRLRLSLVVGLAGLSFALPLLTGMSVARTYYGTDTRAGEILLGVGLAIAHQGNVFPRRAGRRTATALVLIGLTGITAISLTVSAGDDVIRRGLLPALAVLSVLSIHGAVSGHKVLKGALETGPVQFLGSISYPVYLLHWPIMVALRWYDVSDYVVAPVGLAGSALLSLPLTRFVEKPLRRRAPRPAWLAWVATTAVVLIALSLVVKPPAAAQFLADLERDQQSAASVATTVAPTTMPTPTSDPVTNPTTDTPTTGGPTTTVAPPLPTVAVFGDSAALSVALLLYGQVPREEVNYVGSSTMLGCGLAHELEPERCAAVPQQWSDFLSLQPTDVVLLMSCQWELVEREVPDAGTQVVGEPEINEIIAAGYRASVDLLLSHGVDTVAWMLCPEYSNLLGDDAVPEVNRSRDPVRLSALNMLIRNVAGEYEGDVVLIDLYAWMQPFTDDGELRPDGAHFAYDHPTVFSAALPGLLADALAAVPGDDQSG